MKNKRYFGLIWMSMLAVLFACEPYIDDKPEAGFVAPPAANEMDFSITPGNDAFHYKLEMLSPQIDGVAIVSFDLGNGSKVTGKSATAYYPLPGNYTITMNIKTNGGSSEITKSLTTTETDYSIFTDEKFIMLSGGADDLDGKTWVLDSLSAGHIGVGPAGTVGLEWWSAAPLAKKAVGVLYDDEINFKVTGFVATLTNRGKSYVKGFVRTSPGYSNAFEQDGDWVVNYTPSPGTWFIEESNGKNYLKLSGPTPMFPCFDVGATNGSYEILKLEENLLELVTIDRVEGNAWHYQLIPKGYVKPSVTAELSVEAVAEANTYDISLANFNIPEGQSISGVTFSFGEGDAVQNDDYTAVATHTYMRAGTYTVTAVVATSVGDLTLTKTVNVAANHPDYVPFLLDEMIIYNDFSEVALAPVNGQDCSVSTMANPSRTYPNRSASVAKYSKTNNEWANANLQLPAGYRFDIRIISTFKMMVNGKAGDVVLLKLENTDWGGNAWMSGVELTYTIKKDNTWEVAEYNFAGVANNGSAGDVFTKDVTNPASAVSHDFYNVVRIMLNPGNGVGTHEFYFDELSGPHVEGIKSVKIH